MKRTNFKGDLYSVAYDALAQMELPDFSGSRDRDVFDTFKVLFKQYKEDPDGVLENLNNEISRRSGGLTELRTLDTVPSMKGPGTSFELVKNGLIRKLSFGPYATPFRFID